MVYKWQTMCLNTEKAYFNTFYILNTRLIYPASQVVKKVANYSNTHTLDTRHWKHYWWALELHFMGRLSFLIWFINHNFIQKNIPKLVNILVFQLQKHFGNWFTEQPAAGSQQNKIKGYFYYWKHLYSTVCIYCVAIQKCLDFS